MPPTGQTKQEEIISTLSSRPNEFMKNALYITYATCGLVLSRVTIPPSYEYCIGYVHC